LVFDLGNDVTIPAKRLAIYEMRNLERPMEWASLTVAGTSMPKTLVAERGLSTIRRSEWDMYLSFRPEFGQVLLMVACQHEVGLRFCW
jgi:hypothetical protein